MKIPRIILQTSKEPAKQYVIDKLKALAPDWEYFHFTDNDIMWFLKEHMVKEFPSIIDVYNSIKKGQHRADLFRYAFMYRYGGVFIDSDAMIQVPLETIVADYEFFTVYSIEPKTVFQGFLGATPEHEIIRQCLDDILRMNMKDLDKNYFLICYNMYKFIHDSKYHLSPNCKLFTEYLNYSLGQPNVATTVDTTAVEMKPLLHHYFGSKVVPP